MLIRNGPFIPAVRARDGPVLRQCLVLRACRHGMSPVQDTRQRSPWTRRLFQVRAHGGHTLLVPNGTLQPVRRRCRARDPRALNGYCRRHLEDTTSKKYARSRKAQTQDQSETESTARDVPTVDYPWTLSGLPGGPTVGRWRTVLPPLPTTGCTGTNPDISGIPRDHRNTGS